MSNKYLEKIAERMSEFTANHFLGSGNNFLPDHKPKVDTSGIGKDVFSLSKARMAGKVPAARPGSILATVRGLRGLG